MDQPKSPNNDKNCLKITKLNKKFVQFWPKTVKNVNFWSKFTIKWRIITKNLSHLAYFPNNDNKRGFSADAAPLSSALRPRLLSLSFILGLVAFSAACISNVNHASALSLNMTIPKNISLSINPNENNGFGESNSGEINISTDSISGYTLNVKSKNTSNDLINATNNSKLTSITENLTLDQYKNGNNGKTYVNTWGFKPSTINNSPNTNYIPGPDNIEGITLAKTDVDNAIPATYAVAIAAKVDNTIPAGNYSNTFVLTATANEAHYTINYDAASLSGATNAASFATQTGVITGSTQQINTATPAKDGYEFAGWCDQPLEPDGTCKGSTIQPGGQLRMCKCDTDVTLYAIWEKPQIPTTMQDFGNYCSNMSINQTLTLQDIRDNNQYTVDQYTVSKLEDGKCWMTQNLRLGGNSTITLTKESSDVSDDFTLPASSTIQGSYTDPQIHIDSTYGGYYNWLAATAGTGTQSLSSGNASSSICPKGWRLPTGGSGGEFCGLVQAYGGQCSNANQTAAYNALKAGTVPNFALSGYYISGSLRYQSTHGYWWSSTAVASNYAYYLLLDRNGNVFPLYSYDSKNFGFAVRCVARE